MNDEQKINAFDSWISLQSGSIRDMCIKAIERDGQKPLTEEKLEHLAEADEFLLYCNLDEFIEIARCIERAHNII